MKQPSDSRKRDRQDWGIVLLILLLGFLCVAAAGQWALRLTPSWELDTNVGSNLDPNQNFLTKPGGLIAPVDERILTKPAWMGLFLTPGASFVTGTRPPAGPAANNNVPTELTPLVPSTVVPVSSSTLIAGTSTTIPTNTIVWLPPPPTWTHKPGGPAPTDTPVPPGPVLTADLQITLTDGTTTYDAGIVFNYQVTVTNLGPNAVSGAVVSAPLPGPVTSWNWTCVLPVPTCDAMNAGLPFNDVVDLASGASIVYNVAATIPPGVSGNLVAMAFVTPPANPSDPAMGNNTAGPDTNTPGIDLQVVKTGPGGYAAPGPVNYTITVTNSSTFDLNGLTVTDVFSAQLDTVNWNCDCGTAGNGNINDTVNMPAGAVFTYTVTATAHAEARGALPNTVTVVAPPGFTERNPGNETMSISAAGPNEGNINIGGPDNSWTTLGPPLPVNLIMAITPIVADGDSAYDLVYYERLVPAVPFPPTPAHVELDWVVIQISTDGVGWVTVFSFGDGPEDPNTIVNGWCPGEPDNCVIDLGNMYNNTGVAINIDAIVPPGTYGWIQIISPAGGAGDGADVDAIQVLP